MERREYDNGLIAIAEPMPHGEKVQILVGMDVGSKNESYGKRGALHLLEHRMFGSNESASSRRFVQNLEYNGIEANAFTSPLETVFDCWTPSNRLETAIRLAFRAVTNRSYNQAEFARERDKAVMTELIMYERHPFMRFVERILIPEIFKGTPLDGDIIGTPNSVRSLELSDLLTMKDRFYVPNNTIVVATGCVDEKAFFRAVGKTFGAAHNGWSYTPVEQPNLAWTLNPRVVYKEFPDLKDPENSDVNGAIVYLAYQVNPRSHPDEVGLYLLEKILGAGFTSYLYQELRGKRGIGYGFTVDYDSMRGNGVMTLGIPMLMPGQIEQAVCVIQQIIKNICSKHLPKKDFEGNKQKLLSHYWDTSDSESQMAGQILNRELEPHYHKFEGIPRAVKAMTRDQLLDIAQRNFSGSPLIVIASAPGYQNVYSQHLTN